jgi:glutamine synthetase
LFARHRSTLPFGRTCSHGEREAAGIRPLPRSLDQALDGLAASAAAREWFGNTFLDAYLRFKRAELRAVAGLSEAATCARYAEIY